MAVIHISEAEAARDLAGVLNRVAAGEEIQIDKDASSFKIVSVGEQQKDKPRLLSEILAAMKLHPYEGVLDDQFGNDVEEGIRLHEHESLRDPWESY